jgi:subtilisin family serine protease
VGERRAVTGVSPSSPRVWSDEFSVARSLLRYCTADVVSLGFAFPTFSALASIPFSLLMDWLVATGRQVAVVAPAGNEDSAREFWPAADKRVVGVGSTDTSQSSRAQFLIRADGYVQSGSNWGLWLDCAARGQSVSSLFVDWVGTTEDEPASGGSLTFTGWAKWSGTSFAAPKVTAAIAQEIAAGTPALEAFDRVVTSRAGTPVSTPVIPGSRRVPVTNLLLG